LSKTLKEGYRTIDIADQSTSKEKTLKTQQMGNKVKEQIEWRETTEPNGPSNGILYCLDKLANK